MQAGIPGIEKEAYFGSYSIVPNRRQMYTVYYDASKDGLGCVSMQSGRVVAFGSR